MTLRLFRYVEFHLIPQALRLGYVPREAASRHSIYMEWQCCCGREPPPVNQ